MIPPVLILGCGYTGARAARLLVAAGRRVLATSRTPERLVSLGVEPLLLDAAQPATIAALRHSLPECATVLHSLPVFPGPSEITNSILDALDSRISRMVYISTTSVYGSQKEVHFETPVQPASEAARLRVAAESAIFSRVPSAAVLRASAIYGPGRGAHLSIPRGDFLLAGDGSNFISRIYVDDLAALAVKALESPICGAFPASDLEPARSRDVAELVCRLTGCAFPESADPARLHESRRADRRVDAAETWRRFGLSPAYPSYRLGIPAALAIDVTSDMDVNRTPQS